MASLVASSSISATSWDSGTASFRLGQRTHTSMSAAHACSGAIPSTSTLSPIFSGELGMAPEQDRKSTRLNSSHQIISYAVFCLKKKKHILNDHIPDSHSHSSHP